MELRLGSTGKKDVEDEPTNGNLAGGCCFDFNKVSCHSRPAKLLKGLCFSPRFSLVALLHVAFC